MEKRATADRPHLAYPNAPTTNTYNPPSNSSVCTRHATAEWPPIRIRLRVLPHSIPNHLLSAASTFNVPTMDANSQQQNRRENALSLLNVATEAVNLAKEVTSATPAKAVFGSVGAILSMIRVCSLLFFGDISGIHT